MAGAASSEGWQWIDVAAKWLHPHEREPAP